MKISKRLGCLALGPIILLLCILFLPKGIFSTFEIRAAIGTVGWMAFWWVTGPVDYAVTAFLPIGINAIICMADMSKIISNYSSETILLLLGASILTVSWEQTGLDKRLAAYFLRLGGNGFRNQVIFWFLLSATLSAVLPNAVVCATITPIAVSMLNCIGESNIAHSRIGSKLLLTIVYATGVGGLASPLGGAMNLVTVDYLQQLSGEEYIYTHWVIRFLPIILILIVFNILFMIRDIGKDEIVPGSKEFFVGEYSKMDRMSFDERISLLLFVVASVLSFTRQLYQNIFPGLKPAYVFIICAILSFLVSDTSGTRLMVWKSVQKKIVWEMIYIFAGGLAAGTLVKESGAADAIASFASNMNLTGGFVTIVVVLTLTLLLSDITSNTATAAVAIPIVISIAQGIGVNPIPFVYVASVGVNLSYMLPTSIRAIPVGYGLNPKYMLSEGIKISILVIISMSIVCMAAYTFWPIFSKV